MPAPPDLVEGYSSDLAVYEVIRRLDACDESGASQDEHSGCNYAAYLNAGLAVEMP